MPRIRMADADRDRYGGPEWVELHANELMNEETGLIEQLEETWDLTPTEFLRGLQRESPKALRAMIWLARRKAGCLDPVATFKPKVQRWSGVTYEALAVEEEALAEPDPPVNRAARRAGKPSGKKRTAASKSSSTSTGSGSSGS